MPLKEQAELSTGPSVVTRVLIGEGQKAEPEREIWKCYTVGFENGKGAINQEWRCLPEIGKGKDKFSPEVFRNNTASPTPGF